MYFLYIALALVNEHQLRGYIGNPGGDCLCLWGHAVSQRSAFGARRQQPSHKWRARLRHWAQSWAIQELWFYLILRISLHRHVPNCNLCQHVR